MGGIGAINKMTNIKESYPIYYEIANEVKSAQQKYPSFNSNHEGYAVLLEEVDELWDEIKKSKDIKATVGMKKECIQIAAMAIRFIEDLC